MIPVNCTPGVGAAGKYGRTLACMCDGACREEGRKPSWVRFLVHIERTLSGGFTTQAFRKIPADSHCNLAVRSRHARKVSA